jgi:hypothetical protein
LIACLFAVSGVAFGWGSGDGSDYGQLQETTVFFNNSGVRLVHGMAVIIDVSGTGVTAATTMGAYVTGATASADSNYVVGVVKEAANDQMPVVVVTRGPIDALVQDSSEAISAGTQVGTAGTGTIGCVGAGTNLGVALEAGDGTDGSYLYIWVNPSNSD